VDKVDLSWCKIELSYKYIMTLKS